MLQGEVLFTLLHGIFLGPFSSSCFVSGFIGFIDVSNLGDKWVIGIGIGQQGTNGQKNYQIIQIREKNTF
mgnify:CR=1 FL=1